MVKLKIFLLKNLLFINNKKNIMNSLLLIGFNG